MPQIFKGNLSSKLDKIWAQIHQGVFDIVMLKKYAHSLKNIGFNENATHTFNKNAREANALSYDLDWPLIHPNSIISTVKFDERVYKLQQPPNSNIKSLFRKVISKVRIAR